MAKLKCSKCGSERFTGDVLYHTEVELDENQDWTITSDMEAEALDTNSLQCLKCGEDMSYPFEKSERFVPR